MKMITYSKIQNLVKRVPVKKLPLAYNFLADLIDKESEELLPQLKFMLLPLSERRNIMAKQAEQMITHYEQTASERQTWQAGDFIEY